MKEKDIMETVEKQGCKSCFFFDPLAIKEGKPCCTYPGKLTFNKKGICQRKRKI